MKNTLFLLLLFCGLIISCSNEDDSSDLNTLDSNLVGSWNTSEDLTGNTYTYNTDGTAQYVNYASSTETDVYNGTWAIIEENVLVSYYPDSDEEWDDDWKDHPTMKYYFEFLNDCTLQLTDYNNASDIIIHYKEGEDNCYDDIKEAREYEISFRGYGSSEQQYPMVITYYLDDENGEISSTVVNTQTNTDVGGRQTLKCYNQIGFKYETSDNGETIVNNVSIKDVKADNVIFNKAIEVQNNKTFIYNISEDSYNVE